MGYKKENDTDSFGEGFEVTYENDTLLDPPEDFDSDEFDFEEVKPVDNAAVWDPIDPVIPDETIAMSKAEYRSMKNHFRKPRPESEYLEQPVSGKSDYDSPVPPRRRKGRKQADSSPEMAASIRRGGLRLTIAARRFVKALSVILFLALAIYMSLDFYRGSVMYGDIMEAISTHQLSMKLIGYYSVVVFLILMELCFAIYSLTTVTMVDDYGYYKEDVGHGLGGFIFTYLTSYACFWISSYVPEVLDILKGFKGAINVYGAMHNVLFGICIAGVIACLVRKFAVLS